MFCARASQGRDRHFYWPCKKMAFSVRTRWLPMIPRFRISLHGTAHQTICRRKLRYDPNFICGSADHRPTGLNGRFKALQSVGSVLRIREELITNVITSPIAMLPLNRRSGNVKPHFGLDGLLGASILSITVLPYRYRYQCLVHIVAFAFLMRLYWSFKMAC